MDCQSCAGTEMGHLANVPNFCWGVVPLAAAAANLRDRWKTFSKAHFGFGNSACHLVWPDSSRLISHPTNPPLEGRGEPPPFPVLWVTPNLRPTALRIFQSLHAFSRACIFRPNSSVSSERMFLSKTPWGVSGEGGGVALSLCPQPPARCWWLWKKLMSLFWRMAL